jgi:hypothetical protein
MTAFLFLAILQVLNGIAQEIPEFSPPYLYGGGIVLAGFVLIICFRIYNFRARALRDLSNFEVEDRWGIHTLR